MARRLASSIVCALLVMALMTGVPGCKQEEQGSSGEQATQEKMAESEAEAPVEEGTSQDTVFFEEEEGVEQEDEAHHDY